MGGLWSFYHSIFSLWWFLTLTRTIWGDFYSNIILRGDFMEFQGIWDRIWGKFEDIHVMLWGIVWKHGVPSFLTQPIRSQRSERDWAWLSVAWWENGRGNMFQLNSVEHYPKMGWNHQSQPRIIRPSSIDIYLREKPSEIGTIFTVIKRTGTLPPRTISRVCRPKIAGQLRGLISFQDMQAIRIFVRISNESHPISHLYHGNIIGNRFSWCKISTMKHVSTLFNTFFSHLHMLGQPPLSSMISDLNEPCLRSPEGQQPWWLCLYPIICEGY